MENYELGEVLGRGTYGVCHKGRDRRDGHIYAVKTIILRNNKDSESALKEAEARPLPSTV